MGQKLEITGVHITVDDDLRKYVIKKIGRLDRYLSRHMRKSAHAEVKLKEGKAKDKSRFTCEVVMHVPHEVLQVEESTINFYAAIDIVETKLRQQLKKHKELHASSKIGQRVLSRLKRQAT